MRAPQPNNRRELRQGGPDESHEPPGGRPLASVRVEPLRVAGGTETAHVNRRSRNTGRLQLIAIRRPQIQLQTLAMAKPAAEIHVVLSCLAKCLDQLFAHRVAARPDAWAQCRNQVAGITAMKLTELRNRRSRDSRCGAAPSRMDRRDGAPAAVRNQQRCAVGDTNGEHQRGITADQAVCLGPLVRLTRPYIDHCGAMNLVHGRERVPWYASARRELLPLRFTIGRPTNNRELSGRPPMDGDSRQRDALEQRTPGLPVPRERVRKTRRVRTGRRSHLRDCTGIVE